MNSWPTVKPLNYRSHSKISSNVGKWVSALEQVLTSHIPEFSLLSFVNLSVAMRCLYNDSSGLILPGFDAELGTSDFFGDFLNLLSNCLLQHDPVKGLLHLQIFIGLCHSFSICEDIGLHSPSIALQFLRPSFLNWLSEIYSIASGRRLLLQSTFQIA